VTICTIHAAKGLEWDAVFVPRCINSFLPNGWFPDPGDGLVPLPGFDPFRVLEEFGGPKQTHRIDPPVALCSTSSHFTPQHFVACR